jgi:hypothetical protein
MFRKLILSAVLAAGTLTALSATAPTADAAPLAFHRRFEVLVERRGCWENRGVYRDRFDAERAARHLRREGFRVQIREF